MRKDGAVPLVEPSMFPCICDGYDHVSSGPAPAVSTLVHVAPVREDVFPGDDQVLAVPNDLEDAEQTVILDSAATNSVIGVRSLLHAVQKVSKSIRINGFQTENSMILSNTGTFSNFVKVWFDDRLDVNIPSIPALVDNGAEIRYHTENDRFSVKPPNCAHEFIFKRNKASNLFYIKFHKHDAWSKYAEPPIPPAGRHFQYFRHRALFTTVIENQKRFTSREVRDAALARDFMGKMGVSNSAEAKRVINNMIN